MMSKTLRMTGIALGIAYWLLGLKALTSEQNVDYFVNELNILELNDCWWTTIKTIVVFPFAFHLVAGVHHLFFDTSKLLEKPQYCATGYAAGLVAFVYPAYLAVEKDLQEKWHEIQE